MGRILQRILGRTLLFGLRAVARRKAPPQPDAPIGRIVVMRFGGIGDCVAVTALIATLRQRYPAAHIAVATVASCRPVFENNPDLNEIIIGEPLRVTAHPARLLARIRDARRWSATPYDVAFFAHNIIDFLILAPFFRARWKVGFETNDRGFGFALTHAARIYTPGHPRERANQRTHFIEHFHDLLRAFVGEPVPASRSRIAIAAEEAHEARRWLAANGLGQPLIVLAPTGSMPLNLWPASRYAEVARRCVDELGAYVVVVGGALEQRYAPLFAGFGRRVRFAAGEFSLRQTFAVVAEGAVLVANDTGLAHIGAALGLPLVGVFGPSASWVYGYEDERRVILKASLPCVPCAAAFCRLLPAAARAEGATPPCLEATTPDDVIAALRRILPRAGRVTEAG
jgi:heptosyltransferase-1